MKPLKLLIFLLIIIIVTLAIYLQITPQTYNYMQNKPHIIIPEITVLSDKDWDGLVDNLDIVEGARWEVTNKTVYRSWYYSGWYPPKNEGVCTDVVWRALQNAWYNLKKMIDEDIAKDVSKYARVGGKPDRNIDFRRVPNLQTFLQREAKTLTLKIIPNDVENLHKWQAGDIVIFSNKNNTDSTYPKKRLDHTAIISNKRTQEGVPYMIHNSAPTPREENALIYWDQKISKIVWHYRLKY